MNDIRGQSRSNKSPQNKMVRAHKEKTEGKPHKSDNLLYPTRKNTRERPKLRWKTHVEKNLRKAKIAELATQIKDRRE